MVIDILVFLFVMVAIILIAPYLFAALFAETITIDGGRPRNNKRFRNGKDTTKNLVVHPRSNSEAFVIKKLEDILSVTFPTINPAWLRDARGVSLELDGYNADIKLAIEFSGPMHYKWFTNKESYEKYFARIQRDALKIKLCADNGVDLIVVDSTLPREHVGNYLLSRLADLGRKEMPINYIPRFVATPFRNEMLEKELGVHLQIE